MKINAILVGVILLIIGGGLQLLKETPNERAERINRTADYECGQMKDVMARNCYSWYYEIIEDRD
tara:strand:- start:1291 stop:1485 length:195 start_codon:yes stop_codon:yes gene_type:complete